jgi:hypothetical protein
VTPKKWDISELEFHRASRNPGGGPAVEIAKLPDGGRAMRNADDPENVQFYTAAEWEAFVMGVLAGEFD